jgi:hypothetical protein
MQAAEGDPRSIIDGDMDIFPTCPVGASYMDSPSLQAPFALAPVPTAHVYSASNFGIASMQGHDGLFARGFPIASTCFSHMDI